MVGNIVFLMCISIIIHTEGYVIKENELELNIVHFNDIHARFDEVSKSSAPCHLQEGKCQGGFARLFSSITDLMETQKNPILLDVGDDFQGTLYYNLFKWNITQKFLNLLPITAHTLGNHEFDDGMAGLVPYMEALKAPVIVANIDDSLVPEFQGKYTKSIIKTVEGKKIGIVGVTSSRDAALSSPGKIKFLDEMESINKEAKRLIDEEEVFTVIILSHCGYDVDQILAKGLSKKVSLIVGAHTHTLLYTGTPPDGTTAEGPYPTLVPRDIDGVDVLIVQAASFTRYLGNIRVVYNEDGDIIDHSGQPIYLSNEVNQDEMIVEEMQPWKDKVMAVGNEVLGTTEVALDSTNCKRDECNFGNFLADSVVFSYTKNPYPGCWTRIALALVNSGGIRSSIPAGDITANDIMIAQPFENTFDSGLLKGKYIKEIFDRTTKPLKSKAEESSANILQVSGFKVVYDLSKPEGERVVSLKLRSTCSDQYEELDLEKTYRIAFVTFLGRGGDGFSMIPDNIQDHQIGEIDTDVLRRYVPEKSPITIEKEDRLVFQGAVKPVTTRI